ncbi:MAG: beta strand repeat-containing protein, partial [Ilumatobacteraceae bacterium]
NTHSGNTTVSAGQLGLGSDDAIRSSTLSLGNGSVFGFGGDRTLASGTLSLANNTNPIFMGENSLTFNNVVNAQAGNVNNTYNNIVAGKTLTFNNGVTFNALASAQTWNIFGSGSTVINGSITGSGSSTALSITKQNTGTLVLNGSASNYTGATTISGGVRSINTIGNGGAASSLGASSNAAGNLVIGNATLRYTGDTGATDRGFTLTASTTATIDVALAGTTLTISGTSAATSGGLVKAGAGTLILSGSNTFTGITRVANGGLVLGNPFALGSSTFDTQPGAGSGISFGSLTAVSLAGLTGSNSLTLANASSSPIALQVGNGNVSSTFAGSLSGVGGSLTKIGTGGLTLNGASTFDGGTTISSGSVTIGDSAALGTGSVLLNGGQLRLAAAGLVLSNTFTISGGGVGGEGVIQSTASGTATVAGPITITATTTGGGHFGSSTGVLALAGPITSSVPVTMRIGTIVVSGGGDYAAMGIAQTTVRLGANDGISTSATVDIGTVQASTLDLAGFNQALVGVTKNPTAAATIGSSSTTTDSLLTITGTSNYGGLLTDSVSGGTRTVGLLVAGSGSFTLSAANTFTGDTRVAQGGTLVLTQSGALARSTFDTQSGPAGTLSFSTLTTGSDGGLKGTNGFALQNDSAAALNLAVGGVSTSSTFAGVLSGPGSLTKVGTGAFLLTNANTYSGSTTLTAGSLEFTTPSNLGSGTLAFNGGALRAIGTANPTLTMPIAVLAASTIDVANQG